MKKLLSVLIALSLLFPCFTVFSENTDNMEKVLISVKERIPDTKQFENFDSRINTYNGNTVYHFEWYTEKDAKFTSLNISVTESGIITAYSYYTSDNESYNSKPQINRISLDEGLKKAAMFVNKLNPTIANELITEKLSQSENLFDNTLRFSVKRYINNLPVYGNDGYITLDLNAEKVLNFSLNFSENVSFPSPSDIISKDSAVSAYKDKLGLKLKYFIYNENKQKIAYPAYIPSKDSLTFINATDGEVFEIKQDDIRYTVNSSTGNLKNEATMDMLSKPEQAEIDKISGLLSEEQLIKIIKNNKYTSYDTDFKKTYFSISKDYYSENYFANFNFETKGENISYASYTLNAKTGEIISFHKGKQAVLNVKPKITEEKAKKLMDDAVKYLSGSKFEEYKPKSQSAFSKQYIRYINNIPTDDYINISIDESSGKILRYSIAYSDISFPSVDGVISPQNAVDKLLEQTDYVPCYVISENKAVAVYRFKSPISIALNPFNGKLITYENKEYVPEQTISYNDISGHWAENTINELSRYGIGFGEESFSPDSVITKKDYLTLIVSAFISNQPIILKNNETRDNIISLALRNSLIEGGENLDESITREQASVYMIRAMGIEQYAKLTEIYITPFPDVSENKGYIAILSGLGIIKGDSKGNFNPLKTLTRAEAIVMIYNYLSR